MSKKTNREWQIGPPPKGLDLVRCRMPGCPGDCKAVGTYQWIELPGVTPRTLFVQFACNTCGKLRVIPPAPAKSESEPESVPHPHPRTGGG